LADGTEDATGILVAHVNGEPLAASRLLALMYDELHGLAVRYMRRERRDHTLQPTALVHEVYLRLIDGSRIDLHGKTHFFALAATQMRRILADHARARNTHKRGGDVDKVSLHEEVVPGQGATLDMFALDEALERLAREAPRQYRVVELRFFGGLSVPETAEILEVSEGTVKGDWKVARVWLARELGSRGPEP
jgi:RNA polymerase sigma factor (TIGR02999 family)